MKSEVILNKGEVHRNAEGAVKANNTFKSVFFGKKLVSVPFAPYGGSVLTAK